MRRTLATLLLVSACAPALAQIEVSASCEVDSDYRFSLSERSAILIREQGTPARLVMRQGRLFVDDAWVALSDADRERLAAYEREARAAIPLARGIAHGAVEVAFAALSEVGIALGADAERSRAQLDAARERLDRRLAQAVGPTRYRPGEMGDAIAGAVRDVLPTLVGDLAGGAVRAALSGDAERLRRLETLDADIEARIRPRAEALERDADALCERMRRLDALDDALEYRLPDGRRLDLLQVRDKRDDRARG